MLGRRSQFLRFRRPVPVASCSWKGQDEVTQQRALTFPVRAIAMSLTLSAAVLLTAFGIALPVLRQRQRFDDGSFWQVRAPRRHQRAGEARLSDRSDTGTITATLTQYHVHLIQRPDTGVVDVLISTGPAQRRRCRRTHAIHATWRCETNGSSQWS